MTDESKWPTFNLGTPAIYRITVRGYLDDSWSNQLGGITIQNVAAADDTPFTILHGEMVDQAALFGVLNSLYGLGFPIIGVESVPER
ncbi:MAG: hypothetical protein R3293_23270 [Candidatus Promineifilaceae bacterium]|nr:hypothetical protein [Candidatus Promineifilaceae bacterium]